MNLVSNLTSFAQVVKNDPEAIASFQANTQETTYLYYVVPAVLVSILVILIVLRRQKKRYKR